MESQGQIERKYKKLLQDVETNDFYKVDLTNRVNYCKRTKIESKSQRALPIYTTYFINQQYNIIEYPKIAFF